MRRILSLFLLFGGLAFGQITNVPRGSTITCPNNGEVWKNVSGTMQCAQDAASEGGGVTTINTLTADPQVFAVGSAGTDFAISSVTATHTFNIPTAANGITRGLLSGTDWDDFDSKQPGSANLTTFAAIAPSANVQTFLGAADYAAMRTQLGLVIGTNVQAFDADLSTYAGITPSANVQTLLGAADFAAFRTSLSLVVGTNVQAFDADLSTYAGITPSANVQSILAAADYEAVLTLLSVTATPTADAVVRAGADSKIAAGWLPTASSELIWIVPEDLIAVGSVWPLHLPNYQAGTITAVFCIAAGAGSQTVDLNFDARDRTVPGTPGTDLDTSEFVADANGVADVSFAGEDAIAENEDLWMTISALANTPTELRCSVSVEAQ